VHKSGGSEVTGRRGTRRPLAYRKREADQEVIVSGPVTTGSVEELRAWLTSKVAEYLEVEPGEVDQEASFEAQGLDSMSALTLCDEIEDHLKITVEPTLAWDHPTVVRLATFLHTTAEQGGEAQ
jgi:acyl carrier protein